MSGGVAKVARDYGQDAGQEQGCKHPKHECDGQRFGLVKYKRTRQSGCGVEESPQLVLPLHSVEAYGRYEDMSMGNTPGLRLLHLAKSETGHSCHRQIRKPQFGIYSMLNSL